ncbi:MCE family protein [Nocardioides daejeonensis]|uniref:MCE family protein n=1 Tax=Nocardioides daejeonensis TaxID=1046556 RepID=UPI000D747630|nr:MCE family protein [Nocardioides daejeonensis]
MKLRGISRAGLAAATALLVSSCGFSIYDMPLPGGTDTGADPIEVTVTFPDVLDLVPQSTVKVNDVSVGKVKKVELVDNQAKVTLEVRKDVNLPANAEASIRQTSLLGEKFVSLSAPSDPSPERLKDHSQIAVERTNRNPEVEEVLGALSLVLNGGGVDQLKTITTELNKAFDGREGAAKSVLTQLQTFMGELDDNKDAIVTAIERLNALSISANEQKDAITSALDELPAALTSIDQQRGDLVKMLKALNKLGDVGTRVIKASKTATIDALSELQPVLFSLAKTGDDFAKSFHVLLTYPFVDEAVGRDPQQARNLHMGDFVNLAIKLDVRLLGEKGEGGLPEILPNVNSPADLLTYCKDGKNQQNLICALLSGGGLLPKPRRTAETDATQTGLNRSAPGTISVPLSELMKDNDPALVGLLLRGVAQ